MTASLPFPIPDIALNWALRPIPVELVDISITGLGLVAGAAFAPDERFRIRLRNDIRRFIKEMPGVVRWAQLLDNGKFRIGIALNSRFSALDIQLLKQVGTAGESGQKVWVEFDSARPQGRLQVDAVFQRGSRHIRFP